MTSTRPEAASTARPIARRTGRRVDPATGPPSVGERYLIDNSVWARIPTSPTVAAAMRALVQRVSPSGVHRCAPAVAEFGLSARTGAEHTALVSYLAAFPDCPTAPDSDRTLEIQNALWTSGRVRAAGAMDVLIAAYAIANDATLLHYDRDFAHIAAVEPALRQQWISPPGSL